MDLKIEIKEEELRAIVKEEVEKYVRKRIREMMGDYTSKGYLEDIMYKQLLSLVLEKVPDVREVVDKRIDMAIKDVESVGHNISKNEIIDAIVDRLAEKEDYD